MVELTLKGKETDFRRFRYSSLKFAGRYWNPYVEWREQGAWVSAALEEWCPCTRLIHEGMGPLERCHFDSNFEALLQRASDN